MAATPHNWKETMRNTFSVLSVIALAGVALAASDRKAATDSITASDMMRLTKTLSSDAFEGRAPATAGEERTIDFLTGEFKRLGLAPGNPDGTYVQKVPLVGITSKVDIQWTVKDAPLALTPGTDIVALSRRLQPEVRVEPTEVVFVGYGVVAPEYGWDDYKGVDVRGKTILMLVNDPAVPDPKDPKRLDPAVFKGEAMTYYGRWTYKYEIASEKGAAAAIVIHETGPAGYPWEVVGGSWGRENFDLRTGGGNDSRVSVEGWMTSAKADEVLAGSGHTLASLKRQAVRKDFKPVTLASTAGFTVRNTLRDVDSHNVVARLEAGDATGRDEHIIYTAHWDHLGRDSQREGDQIFNGALDNATGVAALVEIAEAFTKLPAKPRRSMLFLAVTAEEKGLLGAKYYAEHPLYPLEKTLAVINMDGMNQYGPTSDLTIIGLGNSTLDDVATAVAKEQGRTVLPDPEPEKGYFYRSDHFEFAKQGVPALYADAGPTYIGQPADYGEKKRAEYVARDYHKVSDEVKPDWTLEGAAQDARLFFEVGWRIAASDEYPEWRPGTEFKAKRDAMRPAAR